MHEEKEKNKERGCRKQNKIELGLREQVGRWAERNIPNQSDSSEPNRFGVGYI